ncbi:hypothetical protein E1212_28350 [Jiangella ureilytica]|uniref:Uncharacterized protein n=1 Tax=Jiangella ureilytica TaxID=2530374 RepID=A0A4R4R9K6_9ACTN|nr:hypothetical protein [Jiangella ureilytica]TDC45771.1 hypothetical protein E1212_28350 [Jiangella ureilytica]
MRNIPRRPSTITWSYVVDDTTGYVLAERRENASPVIRLHFAPAGQERVFDLDMTAAETLAMAAQLAAVADTARRDEYSSPDVLAYMAEVYLFGSDPARELVDLADYLGYSPLGVDGQLVDRADKILPTRLGLAPAPPVRHSAPSPHNCRL